MTIESSISSTPTSGLAANTGGTDSTRDALTTRNSDLELRDSFRLFAVERRAVDSFRFFDGALIVVVSPGKRRWSGPRADLPLVFPTLTMASPSFRSFTNNFKFFSQSSPKAIVQIFITGTRILGKAFWEASKQAVKSTWTSLPRVIIYLVLLDAKSSPQAALGNDAAGVGTATSGSATDNLTRLHRLTLDEAHLILNVKRGDSMEAITKVCRS
jgi:hypothetical protein